MITSQYKEETEMLLGQVDQHFAKVRNMFEDNGVQYEAEAVSELFGALQAFFLHAGKSSLKVIPFIEGHPPIKEDYDGMMEEIYYDISILYKEANLLAKAIYADFNHHVVQYDALMQKSLALQNKAYDLEAYHGIGGNTSVISTKESFLNKNSIDYSRTQGKPLNIENGKVTLPIKEKKSALEGARVVIIEGAKKERYSLEGTESNGFPGNNHEVEVSTNTAIHGDGVAIAFKGHHNSHANYGAVIDDNPNTWFEYERVIPKDHATQINTKEEGFAFASIDEQYIYWAEPLEGNVLRLTLQIVFAEIKTINEINVAMYTPAALHATKAKLTLATIMTKHDGVVGIPVPKDSYSLSFKPIAARSVQLVFEQEVAYPTDIGYIYYTKDYITIDGNGQERYTNNSVADKMNRVSGPVPSITSIGVSHRENKTVADVGYVSVTAEHKDYSVGERLEKMTSKMSRDMMMRTRRIPADRYCIGIKDIHINEVSYEDEGEIVTKPYYFNEPLTRIALNVEEGSNLDESWLNYEVSIDDGFTWLPIAPLHRDTDEIKIYQIQKVVTAQSEIRKEGYIETDKDIYSVRFRIRGKINDKKEARGMLQFFAEGNDNISPVLTSIELATVHQRIDHTLTTVDDDEHVPLDLGSEIIEPKDPVIPPCRDCDIDDEKVKEENPPDAPFIHGAVTKQHFCADGPVIFQASMKAQSLSSDIIAYGVEYRHAKKENTRIVLEKNDYKTNVTTMFPEVNAGFMLPSDHEEVTVFMELENGERYEAKVIIEIHECEKDDPLTSDGEPIIPEKDLSVTIQRKVGTICEADFFDDLQEIFVSADVTSSHGIRSVKAYEADELVGEWYYTKEERKTFGTFAIALNKTKYMTDKNAIVIKFIAEDYKEKKNKKRSKTHLVSVKRCRHKEPTVKDPKDPKEELEKEFLYADITTRKKETCYNKNVAVRWKAGSHFGVKEAKFIFNDRHIIDQWQEDGNSKVDKITGVARIPHDLLTQAGEGKQTFKVVMEDKEGRVMQDEFSTQFVFCEKEDKRSPDYIKGSIKTKPTAKCVCNGVVQFVGKFNANDHIENVSIWINERIVTNKRYSVLKSGDFCHGHPNYEFDPSMLSGESRQLSEAELQKMSAMERLEYYAEQQIATQPITKQDIDFIEALEEFEIDEDCGCKKKKGTKQAKQFMNELKAKGEPSPDASHELINLIEQGIVTMNDEQSFDVNFSLPLYELHQNFGIIEPRKKYIVDVKVTTVEGYEKTFRGVLIYDDCEGKEPKDPIAPKPSEKDPQHPDNCKDSKVVGMTVGFYDGFNKKVILHEVGLESGKTFGATFTDYLGNKARMGFNFNEQRAYVQKVNNTTIPGLIVTHISIIVEIAKGDRLKVLHKNAYGAIETQGVVLKERNVVHDIGSPAYERMMKEAYDFDDLAEIPRIQERNAFISVPFDLRSVEGAKNYCPHKHLTFKPAKLTDEKIKEDVSKTKCGEVSMIYMAYYDDVNNKYREAHIPYVEDKASVYEAAAKGDNGRSSVTVLAGYSSYFNGVVITMNDGHSEPSLPLLSVGLIFSDREGEINYIYAESLAYTTAENDKIYNQMLGEFKGDGQYSFIKDGAVDYERAPLLGTEESMLAFELKLPDDLCTDKSPIDDIVEKPDKPKFDTQRVAIEMYEMPIYMQSDEDTTLSNIQHKITIFKNKKAVSTKSIAYIATYTFTDGTTEKACVGIYIYSLSGMTSENIDTYNIKERHEIEAKISTHKNPSKGTWSSTSISAIIPHVRLKFPNFKGKEVEKIMLHLEQYEHKSADGKFIQSFEDHAFEIPIQKGGRKESVYISIESSNSVAGEGKICVGNKNTYNYYVRFEYSGEREIMKSGLVLRGSYNIGAQVFMQHSGEKEIKNTYNLPVNANLKGSHTYAIVPIVHFVGDRYETYMPEYAITLESVRC